jgi:hypothetical protein
MADKLRVTCENCGTTQQVRQYYLGLRERVYALCCRCALTRKDAHHAVR